MIFTTVGTAQQPFDRLIKVVDNLAAHMDERVVMQIGTATYEPQHAEYFRWAAFQEMDQLTQESRIVISQAAVGAVIMALKYGKPLVIVPRLRKYKENFNDHQSQLALALQDRGQVALMDNLTVAGLQEAIDLALCQDAIQNSRENLVTGLKLQLDAWQRQK
jgi:UDP-N-acetylglucosamine transferase subunit ALG13